LAYGSGLSACLALYVAFWLELDNAFWAGTSAAIVCQPQLGASLRKGWYRMVGTLVGAVVIVVLTAWFPQDRAHDRPPCSTTRSLLVPTPGRGASLALQARGSILAISEALIEHASYFDAGAPG
jgi:Fusaric acid resistance protein family